MRKVFLHGHLAKFGKMFELEVATAGEAIRALMANFPTFRAALEIGSYEVVRGKRQNGLRLDLEGVAEMRLGVGDLHIVPVVAGRKRGGILKAILGVALIGVALFASGGMLGTALGPAGSMLGGITWGNVAMIGLGLAIAGASQMLSPQEKKQTDAEDNRSYSLSGANNTYEQGNPVPLVYGEIITGGHVISAGIDIEQIA